MRLVLAGDDRLGVLASGGMVDVSAAFADIRGRSAVDRMPRVLAALDERRSRLAELAGGSPEPLPTLRAPVPRPPKLIAAVGNDRAEANGAPLPQDMFLASPDSVVGPDAEVVLPDHPAARFVAEAELALVIGRRAKDLPADERALAALAGYACAIDIAALGLGRIGPPRIGKSFDTFTPLGPAIVTTDEVANPGLLRVSLTVNGEERQAYETGGLAYGPVQALAFISSYMTLVPGDVVLCGSPAEGYGPLADGDRLEAAIDGIGTLSVTVRDPQGRSWQSGAGSDARERAGRG